MATIYELLRKTYSPDKVNKVARWPNPLSNMAKGEHTLVQELKTLEKVAPEIHRKLKARIGTNTWRRLGWGCPARHKDKARKALDEHLRLWVEQEAPGRVAEYDLECLFPEGGDPSKVDRFALARKTVGK